MSERLPCRICGTQVLSTTHNVTGGLCGRCSRGHKLCGVCHRHVTYLEPNKEGLLICSTCAGKARKAADPCRIDELYSPTTTEWALKDGVITHPVLGVLYRESGQWIIDSLPIGAFGYMSVIALDPDGDLPSQRQLDVAVNVSRASEFFRDKVAQRMAAEYTGEIRPVYAEQADDPRYAGRINLAQLPQVHRWNDIWQVISGLSAVFVSREGDITLEFAVTFDPGHNFAVRLLQDGSFYEVMLDG